MVSVLRRRPVRIIAIATLCRVLVGCSDVGDSSALPTEAGEDAAADGTVSGVDAGETSEGSPSGESSMPSLDASQDGVAPPSDDSSTDQGSQTELADAEAGSSAQPDTGSGSGGADVGPTGSGDADAGPTGAGAEEAEDAEVADALDATITENPDTGTDAAEETGITVDSAIEAGTEAGLEAGSLVPCTTAGQTGCVQCDQTTAGDGVCTATEAIIVSWDISKGNISGGVPDPTASCYECLVSSQCIDSVHTHLAHRNCEKAAAGTVGSGAQATETNIQACLNTLACVFGVTDMSFTNCANDPSPGDGISNCYCGAAFPNVPSCNGAPALSSAGGVNGKCAQVIVDGLGDTSSEASATVLDQITTPTLASGLADTVLKCAGSNADQPECPQCF